MAEDCGCPRILGVRLGYWILGVAVVVLMFTYARS